MIGRGEEKRPEKAIQREIKDALEVLGFFVSDFSQPRATLQTPGIPDLFATHPRWRLTLWIEVKRPGARATPAQREWHQVAREAGNVVMVAHGVQEVIDRLVELGAPIEGNARRAG